MAATYGLFNLKYFFVVYRDFGYNDECFGKCGDYKVASFETKEEAEKAYKKHKPPLPKY